METQIREEKMVVLIRVPPGDRWRFVDQKHGGQIFNSLTDALEGWYQQAGETKFYLDARKGTVETVHQAEVEIPMRRFSLYGED